MDIHSLEVFIFSRRFIRRTAVALGLLLVLVAIGDLVFVVLFPRSPLFFRFQFDVDQEGNWTTWFNSTLDLAAGVAALIVAWLARRPGSPGQSSRATGWLLIGAALIYVGMDDASQIHEHTHGLFASLSTALSQWLPGMTAVGWYLWIPVLGIPAASVLIVLARAIFPDIWPVRTARWLFVLGIVLFLSNPLTEVLQARITQPATAGGAPQFADQLYQTNPAAWLQLQSIDLVQELSEMGGALCLLLAFMQVGHSLTDLTASPGPATPGPSL